jgi:folate-binding protein YgfZ
MQQVQFHALPSLGAIRFNGPDAATFLQGQLTADLRQLEPGRSTLAAWCSPQGRVIALMHVAPTPDGFVAVLPRELCGPVAARLARFVMRSRVRIEDASAGLDVAAVTGREAGSFERCEGVTTLRLTVERDLLLARGERLRAVLDGVSQARDGAWDLSCVQLGEPEVYAATSESWVPQMLNLDLLGAVGFQKGCYPGQEIVARTQHLGRIKRRLFRYRVDGDTLPEPGAALLLGSDKVAEVVRSACSDGRLELLAVVSLEAAGAGLTDASGALTCSPEPLPYGVPEAP